MFTAFIAIKINIIISEIIIEFINIFVVVSWSRLYFTFLVVVISTISDAIVSSLIFDIFFVSKLEDIEQQHKTTIIPDENEIIKALAQNIDVVVEQITILIVIENVVNINAILVGVIKISILQHIIISLIIPFIPYDLQNHYSQNFIGPVNDNFLFVFYLYLFYLFFSFPCYDYVSRAHSFI